MDRPSSSTNPLFIEQDDDMSSYVTKSHLVGAQRALHQEQQAMSDRIDNLATDLRLSEQRTRDYFDNKLDAHKQENDARMDEIRALFCEPASFYILIFKTEPLKSPLRRLLLRHKYTVIEHSSTSRASRPSCISQPAT